MTKKVFVTGATGFIGANLVKTLLQQGYDVHALVRKGSTHPFLHSLNIEKKEGDLFDIPPSLLEKYCEPCDAIIHLAAMISFNEKDSRSLYEINVHGTKKILSVAEKQKKRIVFVSSGSTIGKPSSEKKIMNEKERFIFPQNGYAHTKYLGEQVTIRAAQRGVDAVIVNPSTVYGAGDTWGNAGLVVQLLKKYPVFIAPPGGCSVIAVQDVVTGIIAALEKGKSGERYILTAENISYKKLFETIYDVFGKKRKIRAVPQFFGILATTLLKKIPTSSPIITPAVMENLFLHRYLDNSKAKKELSWMPVTPLDQAIREMVTFYEEAQKKS